MPRFGDRKPVAERFWPKVDIRAPDECWPWTGSKLTGREIGTFWGGDRMVYAHRQSYELANGPIPEGLVICHSCDNPICVNPAHLRADTQYENMQDRKRAGHYGPDFMRKRTERS